MLHTEEKFEKYEKILLKLSLLDDKLMYVSKINRCASKRVCLTYMASELPFMSIYET